MPAKVSQQVIKSVDESYKSFFALLKEYENGKIKHKPKAPKFSPRGEEGRFLLEYSYQAVSKKHFKNKIIKLSKLDCYFKLPKHLNHLDFNDLCEVRIVPKDDFYNLEIVYKVKAKEHNSQGVTAAIDWGGKNLLTIVSKDFQPLIVKSGKFLNTNNYFLTECKKRQSKLAKGQYSSKAIKHLTRKRNDKINNDIHCLTFELINYLKRLDVSTLVVGFNNDTKRGINLGKRNNF